MRIDRLLFPDTKYCIETPRRHSKDWKYLSYPKRPSLAVPSSMAYYKSQHKTLEMELQEFQASSKEPDAESERHGLLNLG